MEQGGGSMDAVAHLYEWDVPPEEGVPDMTATAIESQRRQPASERAIQQLGVGV